MPAASTKSCVSFVWQLQPEPLTVKFTFVLSSDSAREQRPKMFTSPLLKLAGNAVPFVVSRARATGASHSASVVTGRPKTLSARKQARSCGAKFGGTVWPAGSLMMKPTRPCDACWLLMESVALAMAFDCSVALVNASKLVSKQSENATVFSPPFASMVMARQFVWPLASANDGTVMSRTALACTT